MTCTRCKKRIVKYTDGEVYAFVGPDTVCIKCILDQLTPTHTINVNGVIIDALYATPCNCEFCHNLN
jgi:hypothetical protein